MLPRMSLPKSFPAGCGGRAQGQQALGTPATAKLNGTYRWTLTASDASHVSPDTASETKYPATFTVTLRDGIWSMHHTGAETMTDNPRDTYSVQGDRLRFHWDTGYLTFTYTVDGQGSLHLRLDPVREPGQPQPLTGLRPARAIVGNRDDDRAGPGRHGNRGPRRRRVLRHVREPFGTDEVGGRLDRRRHPAGRHGDLHRDG
jgi:hypothetical protein